jgi:AraC-like DNA-binding protein
MQGIVEMFDSVGLDVPAILAEAGVDAAILVSPDHRAPTEMVSRLWRVAAERSGNSAISLISAHVPKPGNFDIVGYAMLSSQSLRVAIQNFARQLRLVSDAASIHLDFNAESVRLQLDLFGGPEPIPRQRVEFNLLTMLTFCRWVSGRPIKPLGLFLVWPAPASVALFEEAFQCPLYFQADFNGLDFTRADIEAKLPGSNVHLAGLHEDLVQQNSSYQKLLDETRCDLAQNYLARPNMSLAEVAYLLGFADQSAFFRSCKRWFDVSPGQFRAHLSGLSEKRPMDQQKG